MLEAECGFRKLVGYGAMPILITAPALWVWNLNGDGEFFNIVAGQVFNRHARGAREPERVDQARSNRRSSIEP